MLTAEKIKQIINSKKVENIVLVAIRTRLGENFFKISLNYRLLLIQYNVKISIFEAIILKELIFRYGAFKK